MIAVSCYFCGSNVSHPYAEENGYRLVKCAECGLLYVNPRPAENEVAEAHRYGEHTNKRLYVASRYDRGAIARYQEILRDFYGDELGQRSRSWLDIGCGWGEFMEALEAYSNGRVRVTGTEPNQLKREAAQKRGLPVDYFDLDSHEGRYDVLSLLNVYSHLTDPKVILRSWSRLLNPGGELFLETGDTANLSSEAHYRPFYLPDHLHFASEEIVRRLLEEIGFEIVAVRKYQTFRPTPVRIAKELVKWVLPNRQSSLRYLFKNYPNDMFIRARLKPS